MMAQRLNPSGVIFHWLNTSLPVKCGRTNSETIIAQHF
jgi:hypothetical protein